ncbi:putative lipoprotein [Acinetobacter baumannii 400834]|nr:putative lipoprotein [Acinetobacter baumannii 400834]EXW92780.1 putative lipoprotein [Acinetobacter baumannii 44327_5]KCX99051.1 putative lipoprotein [Acinetobacter baumannii 1284800]
MGTKLRLIGPLGKAVLAGCLQSNQIKSNQIKSNQIKSNQIKSNVSVR